MLRAFAGFMYIFIFALWILGGLIHLWTVYIAYTVSGLFWGFVSLFFPVISQIVWGFRAWVASGIDSAYIQWLIIYVALWVIYYIFLGILSALESRSQKLSL